jgi:DNA/RNA endonuclease G (NUC1)
VRAAYDVHAQAVDSTPVSSRSFARDTSTEGAQGTNAGYRDSGYERGHLAQREAFNGSPDTERAADLQTNVVPMRTELNRGAGSRWRLSEQATTNFARLHGRVRVVVEPSYAANPPRLRDGTPIPDTITRRVYAPDGTELLNETFDNRPPTALTPSTPATPPPATEPPP